MMRKSVFLLAITLAAGLGLYTVQAGAHMSQAYGMGPEMMGTGYGIGWFGPILSIAFWIAVIVGIVFFIRWLVVSSGTRGPTADPQDSALEILKRRYARGGINKEEFMEKRKDLGY